VKVQKGSPCNDGEFSPARDCTKYFVCMWGTYQEFSCGSGLHWNNVSYKRTRKGIRYPLNVIANAL